MIAFGERDLLRRLVAARTLRHDLVAAAGLA